MKSSVIDPNKANRTAPRHAASVACLVVTTELMIAERPEKKPMGMAPGGGGRMDFRSWFDRIGRMEEPVERPAPCSWWGGRHPDDGLTTSEPDPPIDRERVRRN